MKLRWAIAALLGALALTACVAGDDGDAGDDGAGGNGSGVVLRVPGDHDTIQAAVDAATRGDLVVIEPGVYREAVDVSTDEIVIRGLDRGTVILDGEFELENGIRILGADGVAVENLTVRNYTASGVYWVEADGFRASYVNVQRNRDYGIYAFDSVNGVIEHSYAAGHPDGGVYVGQCFPCRTLVHDVWAEYNGYGYLGTNSGGDLTIANSQFSDNRVGVMPNSGTYELCYPGRETTIVGNVVVGNSNAGTPAKSNVGFGSGIVVAGTHRNLVTRNLVDDHERYGIIIRPYFEPTPNDDRPDRAAWDTTCAEQRLEPLVEPPPEALASEVFLVWDGFENRIVDNVITASGVADLVTVGFETATADLDNCFSQNSFATSQPAAIEDLAPCDVGGDGDGDWSVDAADAAEIAGFDGPGPVDYREVDLPPIPRLPGLADAATAPAEPAVDVRWSIDLDKVATPDARRFPARD